MDSNMIKKAEKFKVLMILAIVATLFLGFYVYQGNEVSLNLDGEVTDLISYAKTVEEFFQTENIQVAKGSYVNHSLDMKIKDDIELVVMTPKKYTIDIDGVLTNVTSFHSRIEDILMDADMELGEMDYTFPDKDKSVAPNTTIKLYRVAEVTEKQNIEIPFEEQVIMNRDLERGTINVIQEGKNGLRLSEIKTKYINGAVNSSVVLRDEIITEPVPKIVEKGSKEQAVATSRGDVRYRKAITMTATAYDLSYKSTGKKPGDRYYGITASGTKARVGAVAVDPRVIPLGTKLYIESLDGTPDYGFATAEDTGGAIKGNKIDLFFNTNAECTSFGRRNVKVYILE